MNKYLLDKQKSVVFLITISGYLLIFIAVYLAKVASQKYDQYKKVKAPEIGNLIQEDEDSESLASTDIKISLISSRELLGSSIKAEQTKSPEPKAKSDLKVRLVGTTLTPNGKQIAILEDSSNKKQDAFSPGESIFNKATLKEVFVDKISILKDGEIEFISLTEGEKGPGDPSQSNIRSDGGNFVVPEEEVTAALSNLPVLLSQARAVPYFRNGQSIGMRLYAIKAGSLYEKLGLKNSDIIKQINNNPVNDPSKALKLFEDLKSQRSISVGVEREGQDVNLNYQVR